MKGINDGLWVLGKHTGGKIRKDWLTMESKKVDSINILLCDDDGKFDNAVLSNIAGPDWAYNSNGQYVRSYPTIIAALDDLGYSASDCRVEL